LAFARRIRDALEHAGVTLTAPGAAHA
ncbi:LamB/YcsF family protein, partial [Burkholderia sp. Cy-647]|nr:LamB/YcsF family protein [Burkholderia sp. Cy-647]